MSNIIASTTHNDHDRRPTVIALHCSGGSGEQWKNLSGALGGGFDVVAPDLIGCESTGHWNGERAFSLSEEAARIVKIIDATDTPVHLVGHSYGGCVAMRAACERTARIASLTLYEPVAFHVLRTAGAAGKAALDEIDRLRRDIQLAVNCGALLAAAERFVDYWNGAGAWATLHAKARAALARYILKASLDFHATISERTPLAAYRQFDFPVLLMRGEHAPQTTRLVAQQLGRALRSPAECVEGAGHMGPITHAETVFAMIAGNLGRAVAKGLRTDAKLVLAAAA